MRYWDDYNLFAAGEGGQCLFWAQTEKSRQRNGTAGLASTADILGVYRHGRLVPIADSCSAANAVHRLQ